MYTLHSITLERFKTFVQRTTFQPSTSPGLKFISGRNIVEPRLGANGAGKSSLWDGLCWVLFGSGVRNQRAADLASWGQSQPFGEVVIAADGVQHIITRSGSPNRLLLDAEPVEQQVVDGLLGLDRDRFLQAVLFGQSARSFLDLTTAQRGELLDEILDLGLWLRLADQASKRATKAEITIGECERQLAHLYGRREQIDYNGLQRSADAWAEEHDAELRQVADALDIAEERLKEVINPSEPIAPPDEEDRAILLRQHISDAKHALREVRFYHEHEACPTCGQAITEQFRCERLESLGDQEATLRVYEAELQELLTRQRQLRAEWVLANERVSQHAIKIASIQGEITHLERRAKLLLEQKNPFNMQISVCRQQLADIANKIAEFEGKLREQKVLREQYEYWKAGFKRVRLFVVKRILARMTLETANAAADLGLIGWKIEFVTETETKSGTLKPGIQVKVTSPHHAGTWEHYSGGEAQRISLAVRLGIAGLIQNMAGKQFGFEIWDEPSAHLSPDGVGDLLNALSIRAQTHQKSIWLVDHMALPHTSFDEVWLVSKDHDGSHVERV